MAGVEARSFDAPDETRTPDKTKVEIVRMGGTSASRMLLQPGWRWSECIQPIVGGERCQMRHVGIVQSGTMRVAHDDGTEQEIAPGHAYVIEPATTPGSSATSPSSDSSSSRGRPRSTQRAHSSLLPSVDPDSVRKGGGHRSRPFERDVVLSIDLCCKALSCDSIAAQT
jgi:hypothetical protein